jgi:hypothetical protein
MKPLQDKRREDFMTVENRGHGTVRSLNNSNHLTLDWRIQWGEHPTAQNARMSQLLEVSMGKYKAVISRQELENYLRHA